MSCNFVDGQVLDNEGNPSQLYAEALEMFGQEKAMELFLASQSENFQADFGDDATLQEVVNYVAEKNSNTTPLTDAQKIDLQNFQMTVNFSIPELLDTFFNEYGLFEISPQKLKKSGYYNTYEIANMQSDISLQEQVKSSLEALKNNQEELLELSAEFINLEQTSEITAFGKMRTLNPYIVQKDAITTVLEDSSEELEYMNIDIEMLEEEASNYKLSDVYMEVDGQISPSRNTNTEVILPLVAKLTSPLDSINTILSVDLDVLQENYEDTQEVLETIENQLIELGVDAIGLTNKVINQELKGFLSVTQQFLANPDANNTSVFANASDNYFERDLTSKIVPLKVSNQKPIYVELNTKLSENQVYEQTGLIKSRVENVYIQTAKEDVEQLYTNLETYPGNENIREEIKPSVQGINSEAIALYKKYFDVQEQEIEAPSEIAVFTGNRDYLTTEYVSDFYVKYLKSRKENKDSWNNFYSNFEVNAKGINLINDDALTIQKILLYADDNLIQYSMLSTQMPNLGETVEITNSNQRRDQVINNPQLVGQFNGQLYNIGNSEIILKNAEDEFIRIGEQVFENIDNQGNLALYVALPQNNSDYNVFNTETPQTETNLGDYTYLENDQSDFTDAKNYLKSEEKEKTNNQNFNCK